MEALVASGFAVIVAGITVATRSAIGKRVSSSATLALEQGLVAHDDQVIKLVGHVEHSPSGRCRRG